MRLLVRFENGTTSSTAKHGRRQPFQSSMAGVVYARGLARLEKGDLTRCASGPRVAGEKESAWLREQSPSRRPSAIGRQLQLVSGLTVAPFELRGRILARERQSRRSHRHAPAAIEEEIKLGYSEPPIYPNPTEERSRVRRSFSRSLGRRPKSLFSRRGLSRDPEAAERFSDDALSAGRRRNQQRERATRYL